MFWKTKLQQKIKSEKTIAQDFLPLLGPAFLRFVNCQIGEIK